MISAGLIEGGARTTPNWPESDGEGEMPQQPWIERLVRYQYLEPLLSGCRVLEVGCGGGRGAELLSGFARSVVALETSSLVLGHARQTSMRSNIEYVVGEPDRLDFPEQAFDAILVPELHRWISRGGLLPELRRVLAPHGFSVFAVPSTDAGGSQGLSYADFVEYLTQGFSSVQLFGEIPFSGTIMAAFEPQEELDPVLECSLVQEDELPGSYLAICSQAELRTTGYAVIQVPRAVSGTGETVQLRMELENVRQRLTQADARADEWAQSAQAASGELLRRDEELERLGVRVQQLKSELATAQRGVGVLEQLEEVQAERDDLRRRVNELKDRSDSYGSGDVTELRGQLAEAERRALEEANRARSEVTQARRELRELSERANGAEGELSAARRALAESRALLARRGDPGAEPIERRPTPTDIGEDRIALSRDLELKRSECESLVRERDASKKEVTSLSRELADKEHALKSAQRTLATAQRELEAARGARRTSEGQLATALQAAQERVAALEDELAAAHGGADRMAAEAGVEAMTAEPLRRWGESLNEQLERERERAETERQRREEASEALALTRAKVEMERARGDNAERTIAEMRETLRQQRARVQAAEQRADGLFERVDQGTSELTRLHQRIAELQALRQSDRWRMDELNGRLRASEGRARDLGSERVAVLEAELAAAQQALAASADSWRRELGIRENALRELEAQIGGAEGRFGSAGEGADADTASHEVAGLELGELAHLRGDLSRSLARNKVLQSRVDRLVRELEDVARRLRLAAATEPTSAASRPGPAGAGKGGGLAEVITRVGDGDPDEAKDLTALRERLAGRERELGRLRRELALVQEALEQAQVQAQGRGSGQGTWDGEELLRVRQRQLDALMHGALVHKGEADQLRLRIEELGALLQERLAEQEALAGEFERMKQRCANENSRAEGYRAELVALGRQAAQLKGEILRLRQIGSEAASSGGAARS